MAVVAIIAAGDMCRMFTRRYDTVMAGTTGSDDLCVVDRKRRNQGIGCMAIFTHIAGLNVRRIFASGIGAIVAACAITRDIDVVKVRR